MPQATFEASITLAYKEKLKAVVEAFLLYQSPANPSSIKNCRVHATSRIIVNDITANDITA